MSLAENARIDRICRRPEGVGEQLLLMSTILAPTIGFLPFSQFMTPVAFFSVLLSYAVLLGLPISEAKSHLNIVIFTNLVDSGIASVGLILFAAAFIAKVFPAVAGKFFHKNG